MPAFFLLLRPLHRDKAQGRTGHRLTDGLRIRRFGIPARFAISGPGIPNRDTPVDGPVGHHENPGPWALVGQQAKVNQRSPYVPKVA